MWVSREFCNKQATASCLSCLSITPLAVVAGGSVSCGPIRVYRRYPAQLVLLSWQIFNINLSLSFHHLLLYLLSFTCSPDVCGLVCRPWPTCGAETKSPCSLRWYHLTYMLSSSKLPPLVSSSPSFVSRNWFAVWCPLHVALTLHPFTVFPSSGSATVVKWCLAWGSKRQNLDKWGIGGGGGQERKV